MNIEDEKKLDRLLADMPKPQYDLDGWLEEDEMMAFDRIVSQRRRRKAWRWLAAAAILFMIIGVGVTMWPLAENSPKEVAAVIEPTPASAPTKTEQKVIVEEEVQPIAPQIAAKPKRHKAVSKPKREIPDTLGNGIWQREENVVRAMQMLADCEATIQREEQQVRNAVIEATFRATPQPANIQLVTNENGDYFVSDKSQQTIIEI